MTDKTTDSDPIEDELFFRAVETKLNTLIKEYDPQQRFIMIVYSREDVQLFANCKHDMDDSEELKILVKAMVTATNGLSKELQNPDSYNSSELN